ncbi:PTS sugar transporter subunit IIA [Lactovum odontotermitis]
MIGLLIATHGRLGQELIDTAELIAGKMSQVSSVGLGLEDNAELFVARVKEKVGELDTGDGVLIMNDLFGGTPSNASIYLSAAENVWTVAGVNLPMVLEYFNLRENKILPMEELAESVCQAGKEYVLNSTKKIQLKEEK